jgi:hypothetical protein
MNSVLMIFSYWDVVALLACRKHVCSLTNAYVSGSAVNATGMRLCPLLSIAVLGTGQVRASSLLRCGVYMLAVEISFIHAVELSFSPLTSALNSHPTGVL